MAPFMTHLSTHVLDLARGKPAAGVPVRLEQQDTSGAWQPICSARADNDGRTRKRGARRGIERRDRIGQALAHEIHLGRSREQTAAQPQHALAHVDEFPDGVPVVQALQTRARHQVIGSRWHAREFERAIRANLRVNVQVTGDRHIAPRQAEPASPVGDETAA